MSTFDIPTGSPPIQGNLAYNIHREEARRAKRRQNTKPKMGSFAYDREKGGMTLQWENKDAFLAWVASEESNKTIELVVSQTLRSTDSPDWRERSVLRCSRGLTGGKSDYQKRHEWERKIPSKKTDCQCNLTIKRYPNTEVILGKYHDEHNHPLGDDNLRFLRLSDKIRNLVMDMVHIGIESKIIVSHASLFVSRVNGYCGDETRTRVLHAD